MLEKARIYGKTKTPMLTHCCLSRNILTYPLPYQPYSSDYKDFDERTIKTESKVGAKEDHGKYFLNALRNIKKNSSSISAGNYSDKHEIDIHE